MIKNCKNDYANLELFSLSPVEEFVFWQIQAFWLVVGLSLLSWLIFPLPLQYLKFSELIWFLRRNSCKIIILLWHFPYQKQNFLRKLFLLLLFSPIDSKLSNPYTKHVYLNIMLIVNRYYMENLESTTLELLCIQSPWWKFWA